MKFKKNIEPIFIIGVGRSELVCHSALNSHSKIAFTPETHFIRSYIARKINLRNNTNKILNDII